MQEISSITKENEIDVIYGMVNLREERELARASVKYILTDMSDIRRSFIRLGFHLYEFERMRYYEDFGYTSIAEFAEKNLGLSKTQVSVYKNIYLEFGFYDEHSSVPKMWLDDKYKQYSYSQLREMLPMSEEKRKQVKPDMTIEQIREIKKPKANVAISQPGMKLLCLIALLEMLFVVLIIGFKSIERLYQADPTATIISFAFVGIMLLANIIIKIIGDYKDKHDKETKNKY